MAQRPIEYVVLDYIQQTWSGLKDALTPTPADRNLPPPYYTIINGQRVPDYETNADLWYQVFQILWRTFTWPFRAIWGVICTISVAVFTFIWPLLVFLGITFGWMTEILLELIITTVEAANGFWILAQKAWDVVLVNSSRAAKAFQYVWNIIAFCWSTIILAPFRFAYFLVENDKWQLWFIFKWLWYLAIFALVLLIAAILHEMFYRSAWQTRRWWRWQKKCMREWFYNIPNRPSPVIQGPVAVYTFISDLYAVIYDFFDKPNSFWDARDMVLRKCFGIERLPKRRIMFWVYVTLATIVYYVSFTYSPTLAPYDQRIFRQGLWSLQENFNEHWLPQPKRKRAPLLATTREGLTTTVENIIESLNEESTVVTTTPTNVVVDLITPTFENAEQSQELVVESATQAEEPSELPYHIVVRQWNPSLNRFEVEEEPPSSTTEKSKSASVETKYLGETATIVERETTTHTEFINKVITETETLPLVEVMTEYLVETTTLPAETTSVTEYIVDTVTLPAETEYIIETTTLPAETEYLTETSTHVHTQTEVEDHHHTVTQVHSLLNIGQPDSLPSSPEGFWELPKATAGKRHSLGEDGKVWCSTCGQFHCCELPY